MDAIKKYKLSILDEQFSVVSDESEELVLLAAARVDEIMRGIIEKAPSLERKKAAVLSALRISIEHERLQQSSRSMQNSLNHLSQSIEDALLIEEL